MDWYISRAPSRWNWMIKKGWKTLKMKRAEQVYYGLLAKKNNKFFSVGCASAACPPDIAPEPCSVDTSAFAPLSTLPPLRLRARYNKEYLAQN